MDLLTIGAFAQASRLSPKALRLYDSLGLLTPAHVDEVSGYRFYRPDQLERARLVAWLRRLGMPLARIGAVCDLTRDAPDQAAGLIAAYWTETEVELTARRALAAHLISYLSGEEPTMPGTQPTLAIRYAARSDIGRHRERNQDTAYAGQRLLAVADGMGADGEAASAAVIEALKPLEAALPAGNLLNAMEDAVRQVGAALADADPGTGTTLTAMLWSGSQLALVHVGDTRAYLLRAGELFQITHHPGGPGPARRGQDHRRGGRVPSAAVAAAAGHPRRRRGRTRRLAARRAGWRSLPAVLRRPDHRGHPRRHPGYAQRARRPGAGRGAAHRPGQRGRGPDNIACVVADVVEPRPGSV